MVTYVADIETDGFDSTKIHCFGYGTTLKDIRVMTDYDEMRELLLRPDVTFVMHNGICFDFPQLEKVLGVKIRAKIIDTLPLSWYLFPERDKHGLESWGEEFGIPKPAIDDWENLPLEEYINRVTEDVKINIQMWEKAKRRLQYLYDTKEVENLPIIHYLNFKMDCAALQSFCKWRVDVSLAQKVLDGLYEKKEAKEAILRAVMPQMPVKVKRTRPLKPFKKDGSHSEAGARWFKLISDQGLTEDWTDPISEITGYEEANPSSPDQVKAWLFSLGWEPCTFDYKKNSEGVERAIPQVKKPKEPELTDSVLALADDQPAILELQDLSIINHRISVFKGILENVDDDGCVKAEIAGLTNTLRFKHRSPCVNLPGVDKPYGKEIRSCFIARDGYELCGADMVSLEATTKAHFMYPHDPEYALTLTAPGFDEHLDLAVHAGALTPEQVEAHKAGTENHSKVRKMYKPVNYSGIYGIGAPKLSRAIRKSEAEAAKLLDDYWTRNWAIREVAKEQTTKEVAGSKWLFNPISKFWYSLRADKDRFSTLNQGTGAYCFDQWVAQVLKRRRQMNYQAHDEGCWEVKLGHRDKMTALLQDSIDAVNDKLKLNVKLKVSVQYGDRYGDIH